MILDAALIELLWLQAPRGPFLCGPDVTLGRCQQRPGDELLAFVVSAV